LCLELVSGGLDVLALAPSYHAVHGVEALRTSCLGQTPLVTIGRAIDQFVPDLVVPGDEKAIDYLWALHSKAIVGHGGMPPAVAALIEKSLGPPSSFAFARRKSCLMQFARREGLLVPDTEVVRDAAHFHALVKRAQFPLVVKLDDGSNGHGVRIVRNAKEAKTAFSELKFLSSPFMALIHAMDQLDMAYLTRFLYRGPAISIQEYIEGPAANRAVFCRQGKVLAGLSVETLQTSVPNGGATVVKVIDSREMAATAARVVELLHLTGFAGFDFVLHAKTRQPYLVELNARPTPICHIALDDTTDLVGAMWPNSKRKVPNVDSSTIALFPMEIWRDPHSAHLRSAYHDLPFRTPELIALYRNRTISRPHGWLKKIANLAKGRAKH
jgi:glutathione synthase/RimK-type ligase-like ATP-grasp enzyme